MISKLSRPREPKKDNKLNINLSTQAKSEHALSTAWWPRGGRRMTASASGRFLEYCGSLNDPEGIGGFGGKGSASGRDDGKRKRPFFSILRKLEWNRRDRGVWGEWLRAETGLLLFLLGSRHGQLLGAVFLIYFRKTYIAKNMVLRGELVSFPYGAKAVHRSSVVFLNSF